jgi:hypothetical protein
MVLASEMQLLRSPGHEATYLGLHRALYVAPLREGIAEGGHGCHHLGAGVDTLGAQLEVFGPVRYETPAECVERALRGLGIEAHDKHRIRRRDVEARWIVRQRVAEAEEADDLGGGQIVQKSTAHPGNVVGDG